MSDLDTFALAVVRNNVLRRQFDSIKFTVWFFGFTQFVIDIILIAVVAK